MDLDANDDAARQPPSQDPAMPLLLWGLRLIPSTCTVTGANAIQKLTVIASRQ